MLLDRTVRRLKTTEDTSYKKRGMEDTRIVLTQPKGCHVGSLSPG